MRGHRALPPLAILPLAALSLLAEPALADVPPADYFTGVYERIGRSAGPKPGLLNDLWRIDPAQGGTLALSPCGSTDPTAALRFTRIGELTNLLQGEGGLWCQFFNDGGNYPLLSCGAEDGTAYQMRVVTDARAEACPAAAR